MLKGTYKKGKKEGEWILRVEGESKRGAIVEVTTKAGKKKFEEVGFVLWTDKKISLCSIKKDKREENYYVGQDCPRCDSEELDNKLHCWECGFTA